jgi:hypothetical protein
MTERLPPRARARILVFAEAEHSLMTTIRSNQAHIKELEDALAMTAENERKLDLREQINQRKDVMETQRERHRHMADLNAKIRNYLDLLPADTVIDAVKPVKVKLPEGKSHQQAVTDLRTTIVKLIAERAAVERVALPIEEQKAQIKKWIVEKGLRARPSIVINHERMALTWDHKLEDAYTPTIDLLAWAAWYDPEYLEQKLIAQLEEMPKPKFALTPLEKSQRLAAIKLELAEAEKAEVNIIDAASDQGVVIEHRGNVSIPILLGITFSRIPKAPSKAA